MKINYLSDIHLEFSGLTPPDIDSDVVVLAGDVHTKGRGIKWAQETYKNKPILYILGNHELYGQALPNYLKKLRDMSVGTNIHILENEHIELDGIHFLGCTLWTDFRLFGDPMNAIYNATEYMTDYKKIRVSPGYRKLKPIDTIGLHYNSINWLKKQTALLNDKKVVIITHHAPSSKSLIDGRKADILDAAYASELDHFVESSGALLWIHGHIHEQKNYYIGKTKVLCNPRGYSMELNSNFIPDLVIEV